MPLIRLDKYITDTGACSRSRARDRIRSGAVLVDGAAVTDPAAKIDPETVSVRLDGALLNAEEHIYVMLHKPAGLLTASRDRHRATVLDAMPEEWKRRGLFPVGRLDKDTTGLLLLTDDGVFAHRVISPKSGVTKSYLAGVDGVPGPEDVRAFASGIELKDGTKYHQIKRMLASRGLPVLSLHRESIGALKLDPSLAPGEYRLLTAAETETIAPGILSK